MSIKRVNDDQAGSGCKVGEAMLRFELDTDNSADPVNAESAGDAVGGDTELTLLGELAVREKSTVLQLKELLIENWASLSTSIAVPPTPNHLRVRDGKVLFHLIFCLLNVNELLTNCECSTRILKLLVH